MAVGHRGSLPPLMGQWMPSPALPDFQSGHSVRPCGHKRRLSWEFVSDFSVPFCPEDTQRQ